MQLGPCMHQHAWPSPPISQSEAHLAMKSSALGGAWPAPGRVMPAATLPGALLNVREVE